jgi:hypothetical protein
LLLAERLDWPAEPNEMPPQRQTGGEGVKSRAKSAASAQCIGESVLLIAIWIGADGIGSGTHKCAAEMPKN